ncbi:MAG: hypothetical protein KTR14_09020 [Vampirovibrio sp.]|nr:hypothetical protein [Vampirovibrio sp.]
METTLTPVQASPALQPSPYAQAPIAPMHPDRAIYQAASWYGSAIPYADTALAGLTAKGSAATKVSATAKRATGWAAFMGVTNLYHKAVNWMAQKNPGLAEQMNRHPIALGLPIAAVGLALGITASIGTEAGAAMLLGSKSVTSSLEKVFNRPTLQKAAAALDKSPLLPKIMRGFLWTTAGVLAATGIMLLIDRAGFGRAYRNARKEDQTADPYTLRQAVALQRNHPALFQQLQQASEQGTLITTLTQDKIEPPDPTKNVNDL